MSLCDYGIAMTNGFYVASPKPADLKYIAETIQERDAYVENNTAYEGMLVYVKADGKTYQLSNTGWIEFGFNAEQFQSNVYDGLDSQSPLLALSARAGNLLSTEILNHKNNTVNHITDEERKLWNAKAETTLASQSSNGLMSKEDKIKLDNIQANANNYIHPDNEYTRHVTDAQITYWNSKITSVDDLPVATGITNGLLVFTDKAKLDSIEEGANK